jgi:hypothetical protein
MSGAIPSWAVRGARVVCVADDWDCDSADADLPDPVVGQTYVIDAAEEDLDTVGQVGLYLVGFPDDAFYCALNFRPVATISTEVEDLAMFRKLLTQNSPELVE